VLPEAFARDPSYSPFDWVETGAGDGWPRLALSYNAGNSFSCRVLTLLKLEAPLVKYTLATPLREEIMQGHLAPGQRIIEGYWARRFGVAPNLRAGGHQCSLIAEGFVTKASRRPIEESSLSKTANDLFRSLRGNVEDHSFWIGLLRSEQIAKYMISWWARWGSDWQFCAKMRLLASSYFTRKLLGRRRLTHADSLDGVFAVKGRKYWLNTLGSLRDLS
jgi:hypothetical protein